MKFTKKFEDFMKAGSFLYRMEKLDKRMGALIERRRNGEYSVELLKELLDVVKEKNLLNREIYEFRTQKEIENLENEIFNKEKA